jgi:hypothetical protein
VKNIDNKIFPLILILIVPVLLFGQISRKGIPDGITRKVSLANIPVAKLNSPDLARLFEEDKANAALGLPERMGVSLGCDYTVENSGKWETVSDRRVWKLQIEVPGAVGLGLYFNGFNFPQGAEMYIYSSDGQQVIGAFTSQNNHPSGLFATEVVKGEKIVVEYSEPFSSVRKVRFNISEVLYVYTPMLFPGDKPFNLKNSGACQVNTACAEGDLWRNQVKSVVRIMIKSGFNSYWCSGAVVNNTANDYEPYILTADHCAKNSSGQYAGVEDVLRWIFYFQYETVECSGTLAPEAKTLTGAIKVASSTPLENDGSDFYLVLLNNTIPANYEPYYSGWDISGNSSPFGVSIHHPAGDVKKISTYTAPLTNDQWGINPNTHFRVVWSETANGHGTTEGGSSGAPIYNSTGKIVGQLTGGDSGCSDLTGPDYYGKMSFSWKSNGTHDSLKLEPWLDPLNLGVVSIDGAYNDKLVLSRFRADTNVVVIGSGLKFKDLSSGNPDSWRWVFEGGEPATSTLRDPGPVQYNRLGQYSVTLVVTNVFGMDSLTREDYIRVVPRIYPNPATDHLMVTTGDNPNENFNLLVSDAFGRTVYSAEIKQNGLGFFRVDCLKWPSGIYAVRVAGKDFNYSRKIVKL